MGGAEEQGEGTRPRGAALSRTPLGLCSVRCTSAARPRGPPPLPMRLGGAPGPRVGSGGRGCVQIPVASSCPIPPSTRETLAGSLSHLPEGGSSRPSGAEFQRPPHPLPGRQQVTHPPFSFFSSRAPRMQDPRRVLASRSPSSLALSSDSLGQLAPLAKGCGASGTLDLLGAVARCVVPGLGYKGEFHQERSEGLRIGTQTESPVLVEILVDAIC
jgi:hypothetical protein